MPIFASFNGGLSDAQFGGSILFVIVSAIGVGCYCRKGILGTILGALAGGLPCLWFGFLDRNHRPDLSDIFLFLGIPLGGFFGGLAGMLARFLRGRGPTDRPGKPAQPPSTGVHDRAVDG